MNYPTLFSVYKSTFLIWLENLFSKIQLPTTPKKSIRFVIDIYKSRLEEIQKDYDDVQNKKAHWQQLFLKYLSLNEGEVFRFPTLQIKTKEEIETKQKLLSNLINTLEILHFGKVKTFAEKNVILREIPTMAASTAYGGLGLDQLHIADNKYINFAEVLKKESANLIVEEDTTKNNFDGILTFSYNTSQG